MLAKAIVDQFTSLRDCQDTGYVSKVIILITIYTHKKLHGNLECVVILLKQFCLNPIV